MRWHWQSWLAAVLVMGGTMAAQQYDPALYQDMRWRLIGPFRGGRTKPIDMVAGKPDVFYGGVHNGGVWKSDDYGLTWRPIFDNAPVGSVGALAVAKSDPNIIYVGSGEGARRPDLSVGNGIYKTTDGGRTWKHMGLGEGQQIGDLIVDPKDPNRVFVAVFGHPYGPNAERGVFRSTDGGVTWQKVLYKDEDTGATDLEFDPRDPRIIYADLYAARRGPWFSGNSYDAEGSGLYKSTDGGDTWKPLTKGLPTWKGDKLGRIGVTVAPSDPQRVYATVDAEKNGGIYRSDDGGESWQLVNDQGRLWQRGADFAWLRVDPRNKDLLYACNTSTYRSNDGGKTWTAIKGAPGGDDYQSVLIHPADSNIIFLAADQGMTISVNGGQTWSSWYNQPTAQFYHVITDDRFPYWVYGGQQESGSAGIASRSDFGAITFRDWHPVGVEEWGYVAPDPLHPNLIYGGKVTVYDEHTGQTRDVSPVIIRTGQYRFNRTAPLLFSPVDKKSLYLGSNVLFKTMDGGVHWEVISPDLTQAKPAVPETFGRFVDSDPQKGIHKGVIYAIAPSFRDAQTIWLGTDDGLIHLTRDGGQHWQNITPPEMTPWSKVTQITASHFDEQTAYASVSRFRLQDLKPHIFRTHDGGKSWHEIVNGISEDAAVDAVREDPVRKGLLYAATENSMWVSFDDGDHWQSLQLNLPHTAMRDIWVHNDDLVVGTHGRSFWILDDLTPLRQIDDAVAKADAYLFAPQVAYRMRRSNYPDTPLPPETPMGQNPPDGAVIDYHLGKGFQGPVTIEARNAAGEVVRRFTSTDAPEKVDPDKLRVPMYWPRMMQPPAASPGMHRFVWDLHYPPPEALEFDYPISAVPHDTPPVPQGAAVLPGEYTISLTAAGKTLTQKLTIKMDPRVPASPEELRQQFELSRAIAAAMSQDAAALRQVQALRQRVKAVRPQAGKAAPALDMLEMKLAELVEGSPKIEKLMIRDGLTRMNEMLGQLLAVVDSADAAPTSSATDTYAELRRSLDQQLARWNEARLSDLPAANRALKQAGRKELTTP